MKKYPVSTRVNRPENDDQECREKFRSSALPPDCSELEDTATRNCGLFLSFPSRQHLTQNDLNHLRSMLASSTLQRIGPLEAVRADNLHFPPVIGLRPDDRNPPIPNPIGERMFDDRSNLCLQGGISRVLHLH